MICMSFYQMHEHGFSSNDNVKSANLSFNKSKIIANRLLFIR